jgi:hypothetical protein
MRNAAIVLFMISFGLLMAPSFACPSKHQKVSDPDNMPSPAVGRSLWREGAKDHGFWHEGIWYPSCWVNGVWMCKPEKGK